MLHMSRATWRARLLVAAACLVCAAQGPVPFSASPEAARVTTIQGQVSILHDSQPWALSVGDQVKLGQVILSGPDGYAAFEVSDGSTFEVYANSQVVFRKTPGNLKDLLDVLIGRVKVHIQKWGGQPNFNRVFTPTAVISVRGTTFYVEVEDAEATTLVLVDEGLVEVQHAQHPGTPKMVGAGQYLRVYRDQPLSSSRLDKGTVLNATFRALADALTRIANGGVRVPTIGGGGSPLPPVGVGTTTTLPGDTGGKTPPPPPPTGDTGSGTAPPAPSH